MTLSALLHGYVPQCHSRRVICNVTTSQGLARISNHSEFGLGTFTLYDHDPAGGEDVDVYVIHTGININYTEFDDRAPWDKTIPRNDIDDDGNDHGTHCAGIVDSCKYGIAKAVNLTAIKVLVPTGLAL